jgi:hypothetical protein
MDMGIKINRCNDYDQLKTSPDKPQNPKTPHECVRGVNIVNKGVLNSN